MPTGTTSGHAFRRHDCILFFLRDGETREQHFPASTRIGALSIAKRVLNIPKSDRLTAERFSAAGGIRLWRNGDKIFPR